MRYSLPRNKQFSNMFETCGHLDFRLCREAPRSLFLQRPQQRLLGKLDASFGSPPTRGGLCFLVVFTRLSANLQFISQGVSKHNILDISRSFETNPWI